NPVTIEIEAEIAAVITATAILLDLRFTRALIVEVMVEIAPRIMTPIVIHKIHSARLWKNGIQYSARSLNVFKLSAILDKASAPATAGCASRNNGSDNRENLMRSFQLGTKTTVLKKHI